MGASKAGRHGMDTHACAILLWACLFPACCRSTAKEIVKYDPRKPWRHQMYDCDRRFSCPAYTRPIQQDEENFVPWIFDACINTGYHHDGTSDDWKRYQHALAPCCGMKHVCLQTCGMPLQDCFENFWDCAENTCNRVTEGDEAARACYSIGSWNDLYHLKDEPVPTQRLDQQDFCIIVERWQRQACKCVPAEEHEKQLMLRLEQFYKDHEPSKLNEKGKLKSLKAWKKYKGKRPNMFYTLTLKHFLKVVKVRKTNIRYREGKTEL